MARPQFHITGTEAEAQTVDLTELYEIITLYKSRRRRQGAKITRLTALAELLKIAESHTK